MARSESDPRLILATTKRAQVVALCPPSLRGIELRLMIIGRLDLEDGPVVAAVGTAQDEGMLLLGLVAADLDPEATAGVLTLLRARGLYVDEEQRLSVFFDRGAVIVPREVVRLVRRAKQSRAVG